MYTRQNMLIYLTNSRYNSGSLHCGLAVTASQAICTGLYMYFVNTAVYVVIQWH